MKIDNFDYFLPDERIAQVPSKKRDNSKLLVYDRKSGKITHSVFNELCSFLPKEKKWHFFRNDASVIKARIFAKKKTGAKIECLLLSPIDEKKNIWKCLIKPAKRLKLGEEIFIENAFSAKNISILEDGQRALEFSLKSPYNSVISLSEHFGEPPLPPYIKRDISVENLEQIKQMDKDRYETIYANKSKKVASAAPTAGLHFTNELVQKIKDTKNAQFFDTTLNVGLGTFRPVKADTLKEHIMHSEEYFISSKTINALLNEDDNVLKIGVGTTSLRACEDFYRKNAISPVDRNLDFISEANLFIYPPSKISCFDCLITNFHLPKSTLMCLISTFITPDSLDGIEILKDIYAQAIQKQYNFFSYGDAMLII